MAGARWIKGAHQWLGSLGFSHGRNGDFRGVVYGASYIYHYSMIINVYASLARLHNLNQSKFDLGTEALQGSSVSDAMVGVRLRF